MTQRKKEEEKTPNHQIYNYEGKGCDYRQGASGHVPIKGSNLTGFFSLSDCVAEHKCILRRRVNCLRARTDRPPRGPRLGLPACNDLMLVAVCFCMCPSLSITLFLSVPSSVPAGQAYYSNILNVM